MSLGIQTSISEGERLDKELNQTRWQIAYGPRRGKILTRSVIQDMEALQKDD